MICRARCACVLLALALVAAAPAARACTLVFDDFPSARELARLPMQAATPTLRVAFTHSVLDTPVEDRYEFRHASDGWRAVLVEERFRGEGYGLPNAAGPGETLERDGDGWRLHLQRDVHPLVVRALAAQRMRVIVDGHEVPLVSLGARAVALRVEDCR